MSWRVKPLEAILATAEHKALKRSMGAWQLTLLGVGAVIGTGIFVLTSEATQLAGPGMMLSFVLAAMVCGVAALCYSEIASMVPVAGSAYTYTYAVMGELLAWMVGWSLILEYAVAASAVSVGWSGYFVGQLKGWFGIELPYALVNGPYAQGFVNLPAVCIALLITWLLVLGTRESVRVNTVLVTIKVAALTAFVVLAVPVMQMDHFQPFAPLGAAGVSAAAASIFFAYVGFDAVSTAAEETINPQRNVPLGLLGALGICTIYYVLVAAGVIGSPLGAQPVFDAVGNWLSPGSVELSARCNELAGFGAQPVSCSNEALAHVLRAMGHLNFGNLIGLAAFLALPSVILVMLYGQTRIFFVMSRDGLLPERLSTIHPKWQTPHIITIITGTVVMFTAAFLPVGQLAAISNAGTLFAFTMVAVSVLILRRTRPHWKRSFRAPLVWLVAPLTIAGCIFLYVSLPLRAILVLPIWGAIGLVVYFLYGYRHSEIARGIVHVHESDSEMPPMPDPD